MALLHHFVQFIVHGTIQGVPWQVMFCKGLDLVAFSATEVDLTFEPEDLEATMNPIWNDNGLILGLQSRFAAYLPDEGRSTVDGFRVIARSATMTEPVQYIGGTPMEGQKTLGDASLLPTYMAANCYAPSTQWGQSGARFWLPVPSDDLVDGQQITEGAIDLWNSLDEGVLNSINSPDHLFFCHVAGAPVDSQGTYNVVVRRNKIEVAPPAPPYKGIYRYEFPYEGFQPNVYTCQDFVVNAGSTTQRSRKG